jgi:hypothetical protein
VSFDRSSFFARPVAEVPAATRSTENGSPAPPRKRRGHPVLKRVLVLLAVILWVGAVMYPNPAKLVVSLERLRNPPTDAQAATAFAQGLPDDYKAIENFALDYVQYRTSWALYGSPWYYPTLKEVISQRAGDCEGRALLFASILEAKKLPYTMRYSFDHVWVDYPGKNGQGIEDPGTSFVSTSGNGWWGRLPHIPLWSTIKVRVGYHWTPMPVDRKTLFLLGVFGIPLVAERRGLYRLATKLVPRRLLRGHPDSTS